MKYFVLGALASRLPALRHVDDLRRDRLARHHRRVVEAIGTRPRRTRTVLVFGLVFVVAGLAFKLGAVPFHMWVPDVYHGAPTAVTLLIGRRPKLAAFAITIRLLVERRCSALGARLAADAGAARRRCRWRSATSPRSRRPTSSACSPIRRSRNMGFMLLGLLSGVVDGNRLNRDDAYSAAMFYIIIYVLMTLGAFGMILLLSRAGLRGREARRLRGPEPAQPLVRVAHDAAHVLAGRHAADGRASTPSSRCFRRGDRPATSGSRWSRCCSRWSARSTTCASSS